MSIVNIILSIRILYMTMGCAFYGILRTFEITSANAGPFVYVMLGALVLSVVAVETMLTRYNGMCRIYDKAVDHIHDLEHRLDECDKYLISQGNQQK